MSTHAVATVKTHTCQCIALPCLEIIMFHVLRIHLSWDLSLSISSYLSKFKEKYFSIQMNFIESWNASSEGTCD